MFMVDRDVYTNYDITHAAAKPTNMCIINAYTVVDPTIGKWVMYHY